MKLKILIPEPISLAGVRYLQERGYEVKMGCDTDVDTLKREVRGFDALLVRTAKYPAEVLEAGSELKVIGRHGVGYDNIDIESATRLGIQVTYAPTSNMNSVAEHTIGFIIALTRNFLRMDAEVRRGNFGLRNEVLGSDLEGKVVGLIGLGRIGSLVAEKAVTGLSMRAVGYDPYVKPENAGHVKLVASMEEVLGSADFVSLHLPANPRTIGLIDRQKIEMMKPSAYLINAARGGIVVENDLVTALQDQVISGAALDVFADEPPDPKSPLFALENVLLSPHNAALTIESMDRMALHAAQGIDEVLTGRQPTWPVNTLEPNDKHKCNEE